MEIDFFNGIEERVALAGIDLFDEGFTTAPSFHKEAIQMVKPAKGTTALAFIFEEGVMVAANSRASMGGDISSQSVNTIIGINPYMLGTMAGGAADCRFWHRNFAKFRLYELKSKRRFSIAEASVLLSKTLHPYHQRCMGGMSVETMIAGWDEKGPGLYCVGIDGACMGVDFFAVGSGSPYANVVLDCGYRYDMSVEEAAEFARRAIYHATFLDGASGGVASVYHVGRNGWKKLLGDDIGEISLHGVSS